MSKRLCFGVVLALMTAVGLQAATCTSTGFFRDGMYLTAALVNPVGTVSGNVDAAGCNIGVYYDQGTGKVYKATVSGTNYFGVVVNGDVNTVAVNISSSTVSNIGEQPHNGTQHGVAIYYRAFGTGSASGEIRDNTVTDYQKGGIVVNGNTTAVVQDNTVTGDGRVNFIAQNGIQIGYGATAQVTRNVVTGNAYTGTNCASSGGILVVGGDGYGEPLTVGTQIVSNTLVNNDIGVYLSNLGADYAAPLVSTNIKVINNTISNDGLTNLGGCGAVGYQAGVSDVGNNDKIVNNTIIGEGYKEPGSAVTYAVPIDADVSFTNRPKVHANK